MVKITIKTIIVVFVIFFSNTLFLSTAFATTQLSVTIDKNPVVVNESFILKVIADDDVDTGQHQGDERDRDRVRRGAEEAEG